MFQSRTCFMAPLASRIIKSCCGVRRFDFQADPAKDEKLAAIQREACFHGPYSWPGWFVLWFNLVSLCLGLSMVIIGIVALALPAAVTVAMNVFRVSAL